MHFSSMCKVDLMNETFDSNFKYLFLQKNKTKELWDITYLKEKEESFLVH